MKVFTMVGVAMATLVTSLAMAGDDLDPQRAELELLRAEATPAVEQYTDGILFVAPDVVSLVVMNVRVYSSAGDEVLNVRSTGEPVEFLFTDLPDGNYRYESVVVGQDPRLLSESDLQVEGSAGEFTTREFGDFTVQAGELMERVPPEPISALDSGNSKALTEILIGWVTSLVPAVEAQNLDASGTAPLVIFDDTQNGAGRDWYIWGDATTFGGWFAIYDDLQNQYAIELESSPNNSDSLVVDEAGDIELANGAVWIDRSASRLGIGTLAPGSDLEISSASPTIRLEDETDGHTATIRNDVDGLRFNVRDPGTGVLLNTFTMLEGTPSSAFFSSATGTGIGNNILFTEHDSGDVGIGTTSPTHRLHMRDSDPYIRLDDTSEAGASSYVGHAADALRLWVPTADDLSITNPFSIFDGAPGNSLVITPSGALSTQAFTEINSAGAPSLRLDDNSSENGGSPDWILGAVDNVSSPRAEFFIDNPQTDGSISVIRLLAGDTANNQFRSLEVLADGDVSLANDHLYINRNGLTFGIGTNAPLTDLHIATPTPEIRFTDSDTGNTDMDLEFSNNFLRIQGAMGQDIGKMHTDAPVGTFTTDAAGRTGYGTANPAASFNVKYRSAHGAVPVMLLQKPNNDEIFKVNFNGDTFVNGAIVHSSDVNEKTNIRPVDDSEILEKVASLPIQQWQYKDAVGVNHIGPMAQDFHAAFGLGSTDRGIATVDSAGVALAAIKALTEQNRTLQSSHAEQSDELAALKAAHRQLLNAYHHQQKELGQLQSDRERLARLEAMVARLATDQAQPLLTATQ